MRYEISGIVDPAAQTGESPSDAMGIGQPIVADFQRPIGPGRGGANSGGPGTGYTEGGNTGNANAPEGAAGVPGAGLVEKKPAVLPPRVRSEPYTPEFLDKIAKGKAAVTNSRSFTEYVARAPLRVDDVQHNHPNVVVETKTLSGGQPARP